VTGLRYLLDHKKLPLNTDGAAGWLIDDELWLVVKRTLDELKSHLAAEGQTGIPGRNERLMDELQQNAVLIPNPNDKAIWKATVLGEAWAKGHTLTMLRLPASIVWPEESARPVSFAGSITVETQTPLQPSVVNESLNVSNSLRLQIESEATASDNDKPKAPDNIQAEPLAPTLNSDATVFGTLPQHTEAVTESTLADTHNNNENDDKEKEDQGLLFLHWLRQGLKENTLLINVVNARVHTVAEGVLLVSPGIFKDYDLAQWSYVQKRFQKLKINEKTAARGENIHRYCVEGPRKKNRQIKGFLITQTQRVFSGISLPSPNPYLSKNSE
ncbi:MAG: helicase/relaxase domain-containing protein, partial [Spongiibacteraceae bacterium]|nr:helicase/relaxase domain-containing protein [Spongiibacteraceae bacterium]